MIPRNVRWRDRLLGVPSADTIQYNNYIGIAYASMPFTLRQYYHLYLYCVLWTTSVKDELLVPGTMIA